MKQPLFYLLFFLFAACDGMKTELDINSIAFPPKLSVTAILDHEESTFSIAFSEGRALADYAKPFPDNREIIRNGEIRLYEDDLLILSQQGPFDLSKIYEEEEFEHGGLYIHNQNGYAYFEEGIVTRAGSKYRLEVAVEGYETVVSTATMPNAPAVTASMDISAAVEKDKIKDISSLNENNFSLGMRSYSYWPLTVQFTDTDPNERKYYVLDIFSEAYEYRDGTDKMVFIGRRGIGVTELSKLQDNPDVEAGELMLDIDPVDLYYFSMLTQSNVTFSRGDNVLNYFVGRMRHYYHLCSDNLPSELLPNYVQTTTHDKYSLRVRSITTETFRYYRSLALQYAGMGFFGEPVTVVGNMDKGYGCFSVINSVKIPLAEKEECYWVYNYGN